MLTKTRDLQGMCEEFLHINDPTLREAGLEAQLMYMLDTALWSELYEVALGQLSGFVRGKIDDELLADS
jgi:hypothetical protein